MDNAKIHHSPEIPDHCAEFGMQNLHSLQQWYSFTQSRCACQISTSILTDLNPIEESFSKIKHFLHCHCNYYSQTMGDGILFDMYEVMQIITPTNAAGYFWHAGYI